MYGRIFGLYWNGIYAILSEGKHNNVRENTRAFKHRTTSFLVEGKKGCCRLFSQKGVIYPPC